MAVLVAVLITACGGVAQHSALDRSSDQTTQRPTAASSAAPPAIGADPSAVADLEVLEGTFDIGDYGLYLRCSGTGFPTVVYLHGYIFEPSGGGSSNAGAIPALLEDERRVCVYDRANVGRSDKAPGPLTGASSVMDLHDLLAAAGVDGPLILLGASYGGLIAIMYASTFPEQVSGMVLLDAVLPDDPADPDWLAATEQLDQVTTSHQALALTGSEPPIPVSFIAIAEVDVGPGIFGVEAVQRAIDALRARQQSLVDRFAPGKLIVLDVPHFMEPVIPDRIAAEVEDVIELSKSR
jgi:pimeloyl-ACP methyl ester carboxylesterase